MFSKKVLGGEDIFCTEPRDEFNNTQRGLQFIATPEWVRF